MAGRPGRNGEMARAAPGAWGGILRLWNARLCHKLAREGMPAG